VEGGCLVGPIVSQAWARQVRERELGESGARNLMESWICVCRAMVGRFVSG
jgi:hypothetical protein